MLGQNKHKGFTPIKSGFTLVELLIVIAVLGVIAAVVLIAIDPLEQLAKGRDAGRKNSIAQIGRGMVNVSLSLGRYPVPGTDIPDFNWLTWLQDRGELKSLPNANINSTCSQIVNVQLVQNEFCYAVYPTGSPTDAAIYTRAESKSEKSKCFIGGVQQNTWIVWTASRGSKTEIACMSSVSAPWATSSVITYPTN